MEIILSGAREEARRVAGRLLRSLGEGGLGMAGCVGSSSAAEGFWSKKSVNGWSAQWKTKEGASLGRGMQNLVLSMYIEMPAAHVKGGFDRQRGLDSGSVGWRSRSVSH